MGKVVNSISEVIDATGQKRLTGAQFLFLIGATANVTLQLTRGGSVETFTNIGAGIKIGRLKPWDFAAMIGAAGTTLTFFYGYQDIREDFTEFAQQIASISSTVNTQDLPSATFTDTVDTAQAITTETVIAANLLRRRITIGNRSDSGNSVRVSSVGGAGRGIEVAPGMFAEFRTTSALRVRNDNTLATGLAATWYAEEEV